MADVHTQLEHPKELRKLVLDTALKAAEAGKKLNGLTNLQQEKTRVKTQIGITLKELQKQLETFRKSIPPLPTEFLEKQAQITQKLQKIKETTPVPHHLEKDINEIKQKLSKL